MWSYVPLEQRIPVDHPLRPLRAMVDIVLRELSPQFDQLYSKVGRPSIPPEHLLRALLLQVLYSVRSERLLRGDIAHAFFERVRAQAEQHGLLSDEHFTVDGTLIEAAASLKSFRPKDEPPKDAGSSGGNPANRWVDFHGEKRSNATHQSRTDPDARLYKKGAGQAARLCYLGHAAMENRHGLLVDFLVTTASGTAECAVVPAVLDELRERRFHPETVGLDKGYDTRDLVAKLRARDVTPHVAQNTAGRRSAIDGRTTRHAGYAISQRIRMKVEEIFGWLKTVGGFRKTRHRGLEKVGFAGYLVGAAYNLVRLARLVATPTPA